MSPIYLWIFLLFILEFPYLYLIPPPPIYTWVSSYSYLNFPLFIPEFSPFKPKFLLFIPEFFQYLHPNPPLSLNFPYSYPNPVPIHTWISHYSHLNTPLHLNSSLFTPESCHYLYLNFPLFIPEFPLIFIHEFPPIYTWISLYLHVYLKL